MLIRPNARLFVIDPQNRVLLLLSSRSGSWFTPGGAVKVGETFEEAAKRELFEETGLEVDSVFQALPLLNRSFPLKRATGEEVMSEVQFFAVRVSDPNISSKDLDYESGLSAKHHWWSLEELKATNERILPEDLAEILAQLNSDF